MSTVVTPQSNVSSGLIGHAPLKLKRVTRIALVGPDGVGKSTTIALLRDRFQREFPDNQFQVRQWRPGLLPDLGRFVGKPAQTTEAVRPRRQPGRLHLLRVFYYYWDFLIGSWWKDRLNTTPGALVIYDRCALDMQVDPVRFALQSAFGTRFLARFTPRPDLVVLLEDSPERIWQRKREIQQHEMREQLDRWHKLAEAGDVHAIVRVDCRPDEMAARIWQLAVDAMVEDHPIAADRSAGSALASIHCLLSGAPRLSNRNKEFLPLPQGSRPRFLAPVTPHVAAANSLYVYNPQTLLGGVWRGAVSLGLRTGLVQRWCKDTVTLPIDDFQRFLARAAGCAEAVVSVSLGTPGVHRKPVFQVMDMEGHIRAFAKVGWNQATNELVRLEAAALRMLGRHTFSTATVPSLLDACWYNDSYVLVMGEANGGSRRSSGKLNDRYLQFLTELHSIRQAQVSPMGAVDGRLREIRNSGYHYYAHILESAIQHQPTNLPAGFAHGDFCPWNIRTAGNKLLVLDWEYFGECVPAGWDLFHFLVSSAIELKKQSGAEVYRGIAQDLYVHKYCQALGLPQSLIQPLLIGYLAETLSANLTRFGNHPSAIDKVARRTWAAMLTLAMRAEGSVL
jgi:thymidylate kinase